MASKKKNASFDIPDTVRQAGQSGWVYRTAPGKTEKTAGRKRHAPTPQPEPGGAEKAPAEGVTPEPVVAEAMPPAPAATHTTDAAHVAAQPPTMSDPLSTPQPSEAAAAEGTMPTPSHPGMASRIVGFGLQVAAVPFVVPLYLTAAVSRRLETMTRQ